MKTGKFIEVILFVSGLGLSLITNLFTGDTEVMTFYESNKKMVLMTGLGLTLLSIILSFVSQSKEAESKSGKKIPASKFLFSIFSSTLLWIFYGLAISFCLFHLYKLVDIPEKYFTSTTSTIIGVIVGSRFRFIHGTDTSGMLLGGVIGFASSYYFLEGIEIDFLPLWLSHTSIIASGIISGTVALFTGIFEIDYKIKANIAESKRIQEIEPQIEAFEIAVAKMKHLGLEVKTASFAEYMTRKLNSNLPEDKIEEIIKDTSSSVWLNLLQMQMAGKTHLPLPPYRIFNSEGKELHRFSSVNALVKFSESLKVN